MVPHPGRAILRCRVSRSPLAAGSVPSPFECMCCLLYLLCTSEQFARAWRSRLAAMVGVWCIVHQCGRAQVLGGPVKWSPGWGAITLRGGRRKRTAHRNLPISPGWWCLASPRTLSIWGASHASRRLPSALQATYTATWSKLHTTAACSLGWTEE